MYRFFRHCRRQIQAGFWLLLLVVVFTPKINIFDTPPLTAWLLAIGLHQHSIG